MAKKAKAKKGKKGKDPKPKGGLSHLEKETLLQKIGHLEQKIIYRNLLCEVIDDDVEQYKQAFASGKEDKSVCTRLLEQAIREQEVICDRTKKSIPDAESFQLQAEEVQALELAVKLSDMKKEKAEHDVQLRALRERVQNLESYDSQATERRIRALQKELAKEDPEDIIAKRMELSQRREVAFAKELRAILEEEAESFQGELRGKLDDHFEKVAEETRWWSDMFDNLRLMLDRVTVGNQLRRKALNSVQAQLSSRRESAVPATSHLQQQERMVAEMEEKVERIQQQLHGESALRHQFERLQRIRNGLNESLKSHELALRETKSMLSTNEEEIKELEAEVAQRKAFGLDLARIVRDVQDIIEAEVKSDLIITYNGPPETQDLIKELVRVFDNAANVIFYSFRVSPEES